MDTRFILIALDARKAYVKLNVGVGGVIKDYHGKCST